MLNPHWLRSFVTLVETGSFTRAAIQLDLTQAAVSQHVRRLEDELGTLLIRRPRKVELTPTGMMLLEYCNEVELADKRLKQCLSEDRVRSGEISFITPGSVGLTLYARLLTLQQSNLGLVIRHRFAPDAEILDAVLGKHYELGLVTLRPDDPRLAAKAFAEEPLELVVPAGAKVNNWTDLEQLGFIDHPDGQAMANRLFMRRFPSNHGIRRVPCHGFSNQIGLILEPVARGLGYPVTRAKPSHSRMQSR